MKIIQDLKELIDYIDWLENKYNVARFYINANIDKFSELTKDYLKEDGMLQREEYKYKPDDD